ncbi:hypothetical protein [Sphingomonas bacterium]|uniref:hypothetical protein n=1 Tax=Sphingomonas bacterium TaxID=1895847 RepID=UPI001576481E|nr:hypothetical protein [Sphingomonas bacterium]
MRKLVLAALPLVFLATPAPAAKVVKVVQPLEAGLAGNVNVVSTTVVVGDTAKPIADKLEAKAAEKRAAAGLPESGGRAPDARPTSDTYATLPLTTMMPLEVEDVTRDWKLVAGRAVSLSITIDSIKTANGGVMLLIGSTDELAGMVDVLDAATGAKLGEFYVDVLNAHAGMLGAMMRGSGIREKLAAEFSRHIAEQLSGSRHKPKTTG